MKTLTGEQAQADNIISLFGQNIIEQLMEEDEVPEEIEEESNFLFQSEMDDVFSPAISSADLSLEMGFTIIADQMKDLRAKLRRTNFYLNDLENLLS